MKEHRRKRRHPLWWPGNDALVRVSGDVTSAEVEKSPRDELIDHVWLTVDAGISSDVEVSINSRSRKNELAGFDARIRVGVVRGKWDVLPERGVREMREGFDYAEVEAAGNVFFEHKERPEMEDLLMTRATRCLRVEVWGMPYHRRIPGIHQVHSRRASCAVSSDVRGADGGVIFYFEEESASELWMFKFCGQP